jgi:anti-sigma regulatory factor (Ser/Thr protein kinase)
MKGQRGQGKQIRQFILNEVRNHPKDIVHFTEKNFQITRQAVYRHTHTLIENGFLVAEGNTRKKTYKLKVITKKEIILPVSKNLQEDVIWREQVKSIMDGVVPQNVINICNYGFTEMVNNVVDHSVGSTIFIEAERTAVDIVIHIIDNGVGIFKKIQMALGLEDQRHAILELAKGKLTTDPQHHTGEGIFFSSRMFDSFSIIAGGLYFIHTEVGKDWLIGNDWFIEDTPEVKGTEVTMKININSNRTEKAVFEKYSSENDDDFGFTRTIIPVSLAKYEGENLVSRSQAKRLLARVEKFKEVVFDFDRVETVGQAFTDEIFRVFAQQNPQVHIVFINANAEVERNITRAKQAGTNFLAALEQSLEKE